MRHSGHPAAEGTRHRRRRPERDPGDGRSRRRARRRRPRRDARGRRDVGALIGAIVAPTTLAAALAYYFGYRRQEAFGGYFGIDPSLLDSSPTDYALRSVDALFVPFLGALLVVLGVACLAALLAGRRLPFDAAPALAALGAAGLTVGILLAAGHPVTSNWIPVQALALGIGALAVTAALGRRATTAVRIAGFSILLLSLFWAVSEYADDRGDALARRLAANMHVAPEIHIFSKEGLHVTPGEFPGTCVTVARSSSADYRYHYSGLSLLVRSATSTSSRRRRRRAAGTGATGCS